MNKTKWKVMADPDNAGRHPYHDHRWIATDDAEVERGHDPRSWTLSRGELICQMRDVDPKIAQLIAAAPELLAALKELADASLDFRYHSTAHGRLVAADTAARLAIAKAEGTP